MNDSALLINITLYQKEYSEERKVYRVTKFLDVCYCAINTVKLTEDRTMSFL